MGITKITVAPNVLLTDLTKWCSNEDDTTKENNFDSIKIND